MAQPADPATSDGEAEARPSGHRYHPASSTHLLLRLRNAAGWITALLGRMKVELAAPPPGASGRPLLAVAIARAIDTRRG